MEARYYITMYQYQELTAHQIKARSNLKWVCGFCAGGLNLALLNTLLTFQPALATLGMCMMVAGGWFGWQWYKAHKVVRRVLRDVRETGNHAKAIEGRRRI